MLDRTCSSAFWSEPCCVISCRAKPNRARVVCFVSVQANQVDHWGTLLACSAPNSCVRHAAYQWGTVRDCVQALMARYFNFLVRSGPHWKVVHHGLIPDRYAQRCQVQNVELSYRRLKIIVFGGKLSYINSNNTIIHIRTYKYARRAQNAHACTLHVHAHA